MVRLIPLESGGWREDAPAECDHGHRRLAPSWSPCPECGEHCRSWSCRADGCDAPTFYDDEHVHHSRKLARD